MIEVFINKPVNSRHLSPILVGLLSLEKQGKIKIHILNKSSNCHPLCLELLVNKKRVCIDVNDGYNNLEWIKKNVNRFDFYFKRSYSNIINRKNGFNMVPYGLNYEIYSKDIKPFILRNKKKKVKQLILNVFGIKDSSQICEEDIHVEDIYVNKVPKICFYTRLWENEEDLNNSRIVLVRHLKNKYGDNFYGGIYNSRLSRKLCPDLVVGRFSTIKSNYLKKMINCDICIATTGLHDSIGWKFSEYVIASKAIISEKIDYLIPGLKVGKNYLIFKDVNDCMAKIDYLIDNRKKILDMMNNNKKYYNQYLKPEIQVMNMINYVINNK